MVRQALGRPSCGTVEAVSEGASLGTALSGAARGGVSACQAGAGEPVVAPGEAAARCGRGKGGRRKTQPGLPRCPPPGSEFEFRYGL